MANPDDYLQESVPQQFAPTPNEQVETAFLSLGLDPFPFGAFDNSGRLKTDPPRVPDDLKRELSQALNSPDWKRVFAAVSAFDNVGHQASQLGFRFDGSGINIVVVRDLDTVRTTNGTAVWHEALWHTILKTTQLEAGQTYRVAGSWIEAIKRMLELLKPTTPGNGSGGNGPGNGDGPGHGGRKGRDDGPGHGQPAISRLEQVEGFSVYRALQFLLGILEIANLFGRSHNVACHVVWRYPMYWPRLTQQSAGKWAAIKKVVSAERRAAGGLLWDAGNRELWHWTKHEPWSGLRFTPDVLNYAWYPSGIVVDASREPPSR